jgi:hypothetical protein
MGIADRTAYRKLRPPRCRAQPKALQSRIFFGRTLKAMQEKFYSERLLDLYDACHDEMPEAQTTEFIGDVEQDTFVAATFIASYLTLKAVQHLGRSPSDERIDNFDMLSVYQAFATLVFVILTLPLKSEDIEPDVVQGAAVIGKALFDELSDEACVECIESGLRKVQLIGKAEQDYLVQFREDMDKAVIAFVIAGTDENAPFTTADLIPVFGALLNILCETFSRDD